MSLQSRVGAAALALTTVVWTVGVTAEEASSTGPVCGRATAGNEWEWHERWGESPPGCDPDKDWNDDGRPEHWVAYRPSAEWPGSDRFKIWFSEGHAEAEDAAPALLEVFGRYQGPVEDLFGRRIPSDVDCPCNGGDGRIDIYLLPFQKYDMNRKPFLSEATGFPVAGGCSQPSFFQLHHNYLGCGPDILSTLAVHELTHMVQFSYDLAPPCLKESASIDHDDMWLEATAAWGQWAIFGGSPFLPKFSQDVCVPNVPFAEHYLANLLRDTLTKHPYPSFTFPLFLSTHYDPAIVPKIWESLEGQEGDDRLVRALERSVDVFAGRAVWDETWADFSAANFNVPPVDEYARHDIRTEGTREPVELGATSGSVPLPAPEIQPLAAHHYEVAIGEGVRTLIFQTGVGDEPPDTLRIQALPRTTTGTRTLEDWTYAETVTFCLDDPEQDVDNILLVASNGDWSSEPSPISIGSARWIASALPCSPWNASFAYRSESSAAIGDFGSGQEVHEASATIYFDHAASRLTDDEIIATFIGRGTLDYTWSGDVRLGDRSVTCGGGRKGVPTVAILQLREHADGRREYQIAGQAEIEGSLGIGCDGSPVEGAAVPFVFTGWRPLNDLDEIGDRERIDMDEANHLERSWTLTVDTRGNDR